MAALSRGTPLVPVFEGSTTIPRSNEAKVEDVIHDTENFFSITTPEKIKKAYKTTWGLNGFLQGLRLKKATVDWLAQIGFRFNFKDTITLLVTATHADLI